VSNGYLPPKLGLRMTRLRAACAKLIAPISQCLRGCSAGVRTGAKLVGGDTRATALDTEALPISAQPELRKAVHASALT